MRFLLDLIKPFGSGAVSPPDDSDSTALDHVERILGHLPANKARDLAAMALLLGRVAHADSEVTEEERVRMTGILATDLHLDEEQVVAVTELALQHELCLSMDRHLVLRHIRESLDHAERFDLVRSLFHLAAVDEIDSNESEEIRVITKGLQLTNEDFIALRSEFRDHLSILKNLPN